MKIFLLRGIMVDDLLDDWSKYCYAHEMILGALPGEGVHSVLAVAEGRECRLNIANPDGQSPEETVRLYIANLCGRRSDLQLIEGQSEADARAQSRMDETIALLLSE